MVDDASIYQNARMYAQTLATYTLRQFSVARATLDNNKANALTKLPLAYSRVARAEYLAANTGRIDCLLFVYTCHRC